MMFYQAVEEYMMQNRQRELGKELELKRLLRDSLESKSNKGQHFLAEVADRLRIPVHVFKVGTGVAFDDETLLDCIVC
jgi:hypothetical protein